MSKPRQPCWQHPPCNPNSLYPPVVLKYSNSPLSLVTCGPYILISGSLVVCYLMMVSIYQIYSVGEGERMSMMHSWNYTGMGDMKMFAERVLVPLFLLLEKVVAWDRTWASTITSWVQTASMFLAILTRNSDFSLCIQCKNNVLSVRYEINPRFIKCR